MAPQVGWGVPAQLRAGDTWEWRANFGDFPVSEGWTLSYDFRGIGRLDWDSDWSVSGADGWTLTVPASSTADLTNGRYEWAARMTGTGGYAGREYTVESGYVDVLPDLQAADAGDRQSFYEAQLAVVREVLAGRITTDIVSYTIAGRQVVKMGVEELIALESTLASKVARMRRGGVETVVEVWL